MTEGVSSSSNAAAQRAAEQARLRKERREAKIKAGGTSRLDKITGIGGRVVGGTKAQPALSDPVVHVRGILTLLFFLSFGRQ